MKRYQQLSVWGSLGTLCLVLSPSCDDDSVNPDSGGGDGGERTGPTGATGGATGGTDGEPGGAGGSVNVAGGAGLGAAPNDDCDEDEWLDADGETCVPCVVHTYTCADFVDETPGSGGATNPGTSWDPATDTLTFEVRPGLPPIAEAEVSFWYYYRDGSDNLQNGGQVSSVMTVDGVMLSASFPGEEGELSDAWGASLSVTDVCGNQTDLVAYETTWPSWQYDNPSYGFYCEGS